MREMMKKKAQKEKKPEIVQEDKENIVSEPEKEKEQEPKPTSEPEKIDSSSAFSIVFPTASESPKVDRLLVGFLSDFQAAKEQVGDLLIFSPPRLSETALKATTEVTNFLISVPLAHFTVRGVAISHHVATSQCQSSPTFICP